MTKTIIDGQTVAASREGTMLAKAGQVVHSFQFVTRAAPVAPATIGAVVLGPTILRVVDYACYIFRVRFDLPTLTIYVDGALTEAPLDDEWSTLVNSGALVLGLSQTLTVRGYPAA